MAEVDATFEIGFHGVQYVLSVLSDNDHLVLELEHEAEDQRWRGEYTAQQIEDITRKTGSAKRFGVFVEMLVAAVGRTEESVSLDLLTYADLERLRARRGGGGSVEPSPADRERHAGRRFLIVTYTTEFERVHFPLPLAPEEIPRVASLQRTVRRLREKLALVGEGGGGGGGGRELDVLRGKVADARAEAEAARQRVRGLEEQLAAADAARRAADKAVAKLREASRNEVKKWRKEADRQRERADAAETAAARSAREGSSEAEGARLEAADTIEMLRARVRELTKQVTLLGGTTQTRQRPLSRSSATSRGNSAGRTRPSSRGNSAGRTRPSSRGDSAGRTRPSSRGGQSTGRPSSSIGRSPASRGSASRPRSRSGSKPKFDPTAYVRERREKLAKARAARGIRGPSPLDVRASPGRASSNRSRASSVNSRGSRASSVNSRGSRASRASSVNSQHSAFSRGSKGSRASNTSATRNRRRPDSAKMAARVYGVRDAGIPSARKIAASNRPRSARATAEAYRGIQSKKTTPTTTKKSTTKKRSSIPPPEIEQPLSSSSALELLGTAPTPQDPPSIPRQAWSSEPSPEEKAWNDSRNQRTRSHEAAIAAGQAVDAVLETQPETTSDISDIDRRLNRLQEYLRRAKAGDTGKFPS